MKWSAVITTYNSGAVVDGALTSLLSLPASEAPAEVAVVDNASEDDTIDVVSRYGNRVFLIRNQSNLGLSRANNIGSGMVSGDCILFLNPDTQIIPGTASALLSFTEKNRNAALLGPAMVNETGQLQSTARTWPSPAVLASRRTAFGRTAAGRKLIDRHMNAHMTTDSPARVPWLVGAAIWLTPSGRHGVGLMSTDYFLYFEDVEWCWRAWSRGMEVWFVPEARIKHVCRRESTGSRSALRHHLKSMLTFYLKHPGVLTGSGPEKP
jgi:N-acetylglucosaminyl-diphospho-decaprenol L-rhamnosyltransferase